MTRTRAPAGAREAPGALASASPDRCALPAMASRQPALADDAQAEGLEANIARGRRVGEQHHVADAEIAKDLTADAVLDDATLLHFPRRPALRALLDEVGGELGPQIADQHDYAAAFLGDGLHRLLDHRPTRDIRPNPQQ